MEDAMLVDGLTELPAAIKGVWNLGEALFNPRIASAALKGPAEYAAKSLAEQLAMEEALGKGRQIMGDMADAPRLKALYGPGKWIKMEYVRKGADGVKIVVHYFKNEVTNTMVEAKVVYNSALR